MSTTISSIPDRAQAIVFFSGTINAPGEPNHGKKASVEVRSTYVTGTETRWLILRVEDERFGWANRPYWCKRATGRNIAALDKSLADLRWLITVEVEMKEVRS